MSWWLQRRNGGVGGGDVHWVGGGGMHTPGAVFVGEGTLYQHLVSATSPALLQAPGKASDAGRSFGLQTSC
jgi:hypothetical protein